MLDVRIQKTATRDTGKKVRRGIDVGMRDAINRGFTASQEALFEAGDQLDWDVSPVAQAALPPQRDASGGFRFVYPHEASIPFETGTDPHSIEADDADALAFEWPEMAGEEFGDTGRTFDEVYEDTWPTVFLPETEHPGTPPIGYARWGLEVTRKELESKGLGPYIDAEL